MRLLVLQMVPPESIEGVSGLEIMTYAQLRQLALNGGVARLLFRFTEVTMLSPSLDTLGRPLPSALLLRLLGRGQVVLRDLGGHQQQVTAPYLGLLVVNFVRDFARQRALRRRALATVRALPRRAHRGIDLSGSPLYFRTDSVYGLVSGGSVGHIAGVVNNLGAFGGPPLFITTDRIPTVHESIETHVFHPSPHYRDLPEMWLVSNSGRLVDFVSNLVEGRRLSFVYQRYSLSNSAGLRVAARQDVPFVLEFNGPEVWVARHWGRRLRHERFALQIENAVLQGADLVVVVSEALRVQLVASGVPSDKILVNPNGVDPEVYRPDVDGVEVRRRYGLEKKVVVGFIGTFGRWHGAEVLAEAFGRLLTDRPALRERLSLLMIGDGVTMPEVRSIIARHKIQKYVVLTGLVPQVQGPAHLAACDVLASPHVPNPDGTRFFGSPTKLFEYMAMGKGIVASDLEQIGDVLEHGRTAWMVRPGDPDDLATGITALVDNPELAARLGHAARDKVLAEYTWERHTKRIIDALVETTGG